jgi:glycyl-tRNA synthetase
MLTMQDASLRLTEYWAGRGCVIAAPMNTEVGAGTLNPATALRVLGPEPWQVAYLEPSVRPDDSRYGANPNRLQTHTQFQVILKPEPGDAQRTYLGSLEALGIDLGAHDVRFVEDDWASPALGAWGLGWEVWLDGLEITQFTYFQQSGGTALDPVSVEITYGMERIIMALQGVAHFTDIAYSPALGYGEVFGQAEYEMSRYYLDEADIATTRELFEAYEREAARLIEARLPVPAHAYVLKCSHAFNVLDARGAVGATERARAFARMRALAHDVAGLWMERRAELGHPLGDATTPSPADHPGRPPGPAIADAEPLAFEIGVEELPPAEVARAAEAVRAALAERLAATRLRHGEIRAVSAPRRIIALVDEVNPREDDAEHTIRGPRLSAAYDGGEPTKAALGFARAHGATVAELVRTGEHVGLTRRVPGRPAAEVLAGILPAVVTGLRSDRNMRWNAPGLSYSRPIRWIAALLGPHVVPFTVANLESGRTTRRTAPEPMIEIGSAGAFLETLRAHGVEPDAARRRARVVAAAAELASSVGGVADEEVVAEVANLVEDPVAVLGSFEERYLALPAAVLTTVMRRHQRYLYIRGDAADKPPALLPHFVAVADGPCDPDVVRAGNESVLRARFEDAAFFFQADLRTTPEEMAAGLARLTFEERLGSMADRAARIGSIAKAIAERAGPTPEEHAVLERAARLAKFDLASRMVIELPGLAGTMAREYALRSGEPAAVADALLEMERPRSAGDDPPAGLPGALLAAADRLDLLAGLFAVGAEPTGSADPYGLRRAALGLTAILRAQPRLAGVSVEDGLTIAAAHQPVDVPAGAVRDAVRFTLRRYERSLLDEGRPVEVVRAVLPHAATPARAARAADDLQELLESPGFRRLATALRRVQRIVPPGTAPEYDPALFEEDAERRLHAALAEVTDGLGAAPTLPRFAEAAEALVDPVDDYFDKVLVMADEAALRANRLGLLAAIENLAAGVLDWRAIAR